MTITTDFNGTENYAERMAGLEAIHDWWFGTGSFASAATLGQVRTNLNTILVGTTILNRETFATWLSKVNTLNEPDEYVAGLLFGDDEPGALWQCTVPASLRAATDGTGEAAIGGTIARINDSSGNGLHLTQASTSLRPIRGRRPKTGIRQLSALGDDLTAVVAVGVTTAGGGPATPYGGVSTTLSKTNFSFANVRLLTGLAAATEYTVSILVRAGTLSDAGLMISSDGSSRYNRASFDLTTGDVSLIQQGGGAGPAVFHFEDLGDWKRIAITATTGAAGGTVNFYPGIYSDTVVGDLFAGAVQMEAGDAQTAYQVRTSAYNVTEEGVESVSYAAFDLVDDALTTGAIAGGLTGQAFVAGDGGCYVSDLAVAAGGTFSIGGTSHNWTGAALGILRAVTGNTGRVLDAMIRAGTYTEDDIARLERYYRALGGKGLLVPGPELVVNGGFDTADGWTLDTGMSISGGAITSEAGTTGSSYNSGATLIPAGDGYYLCSLEIVSASGVNFGFQPRLNSSGIYPLTSGYISAVGTYRWVFRDPGLDPWRVALYRNGGHTGTISADNFSVRRLIPREDL